MTKTEMMTIVRLTDDPAVRDAVRRRVEAERAVEAFDAELRSIKPEIGRSKPTLRELTLAEALEDAQRVLAGLKTAEAAARAEATERVKAARRPEDRRLLEERLKALRVAHDADLAYRRRREETAALRGVVPPPDVAPLPLESAIAAIERALAGPPRRTPAPPPRAGELRVRLLLDSFHFRDRLHYYVKNDIFDLPERDARDLLKTGGAVAVAA